MRVSSLIGILGLTGILGLGLIVSLPAAAADTQEPVTYKGQRISDPETLEQLQQLAQGKQYEFTLKAPLPQSEEQLQSLSEEIWPNVVNTLQSRAYERTGLVYTQGQKCEAPENGATADHERFFTCLLEQDDAMEALNAEVNRGVIEIFEQTVVPRLRAAFGPGMETLQGRLDWSESDWETRREIWLDYIAALPEEEATAVTNDLFVLNALYGLKRDFRSSEKARLLKLARAAIENAPADDPLASEGRFAFFERYARDLGSKAAADPAVIAKMDVLTPQIRGLKRYYQEIDRCTGTYGIDSMDEIEARTRCLERLRDSIEQETQPILGLAAAYPGHFAKGDYDQFVAMIEKDAGPKPSSSPVPLYFQAFEQYGYAEFVREIGDAFGPLLLAAELRALLEERIAHGYKRMESIRANEEWKRRRAAMAPDERFGGGSWAATRRAEQAEYLRRERAMRADGFPDIDCDTWLEDDVSGSVSRINAELDDHDDCIRSKRGKRISQYNELANYYNDSKTLRTMLPDYDGGIVQDIRARIDAVRRELEREKARIERLIARVQDNIDSYDRERRRASSSGASRSEPTYGDIMRRVDQMNRCNAARRRQLACIGAGGINCPVPPGC